ncbi:MAG: hypothetical protein FJW86_00445 [Actinobacteria bacterium]|nr:hypothetical protein [Actinomycetota bacterium]
MDHSQISRRAFLAASGGLVVASALPEVAFAHEGEEHELGKQLGALVLSSDLYVSPDPQRVIFGLGSSKGYVSGPPVRVGFVSPEVAGRTDVTLEPTIFYKKGIPEGRGIYEATPVLDVAGVWNGFARVEKRDIEFAIQVNAAPLAPLPGHAASRAPSPTLADSLDVKPICTRQPRCDLHDESLTDLIGSGVPVAVLFGTPARCQSEYCGPVLDTMLSIRDRYPDTKFVHVEIYQNNRTTDLVPTVEAWGLPTEPWMFTVDASGTIAGRLDGAFGQQEMIHLLDALT